MLVLSKGYERLCAACGTFEHMGHGQQPADFTLEAALAQVDGPTTPWAQVADYERDLDQMSEEELQQLADVDVIKKLLSSQLQNSLRSFRSVANNSTKAQGHVDAVRARLKLEHMRSAGSNFIQQASSKQASASQQQQHQSAQPQQQHISVLQQRGQQLHTPRTNAAWFRGSQGSTQQIGFQGPPKATGTQSQRLAVAQQQQQQRSATTALSQGQGALDNTISLSRKRMADTGTMQSDPSVAVYGTYGQRAPSYSTSHQQQMQPNKFLGHYHGPPRQQARQPLDLQPLKTFARHGPIRRIDKEPWAMANCATCGYSYRVDQMEEVPGARKLLCKGCFQQQQQPLKLQVAPLNARKVPPRNPAVVKAGQAAVRRAKANKKGDSDDAPIDLADDTEDEQEQQQLETSPVLNQQQQQQAGDAAQQVSGPAAAARTRRHNNIVNLLGEGVQGTALTFAGLQALYPPSGGKGAVSVTAEDLERLDSDAFLNDTVIDYYIKVLELALPADVRERFHFFNSFFFKKLTEKSSATPGQSTKKDDVAKRNHDRVKSWTKGIDIFTKDYLFVPIHDLLHWSLVIICHPRLLEPHAASMGWSLHPEPAAAAAEQPRNSQNVGANDVDNIQPAPGMLHLDSMTSGHTSSGVFRALQLYLEQEWMRKVHEQQQHGKHHKGNQAATDTAGNHEDGQRQPLVFGKEVLPTTRVCDKLPKQDNHCDCGLFVLTYLEFFVHAAPAAVDVTLLREKKSDVQLSTTQPNLLRKDWFEPALASCLRGHLRNRLLELMIDQAPDKDCSAVVAAVADTKQYGEELDEQRKRLERQQEPGEVNPIFEYLPPSQYFSTGFQQLLQAYQQRRLANKGKRQRGGTGAGRLRQQYLTNLGSMHNDDGALGAAADDEDYDPGQRSRKKRGGKRRRSAARVISSDEEDHHHHHQQQQQQCDPVYGPHLPPAGAAKQDDVSDDFQETRHSNRGGAAAAAAAGGAASKQRQQRSKPALLQQKSQGVQELWHQQQQQQETEDCEPSDLHALLPPWQQQQHGASADPNRSQGPHSDLRKKPRLPLDDAGGSAVAHTSSSSDVTCSDSPKDHSPGEGFMTAADDDETSPGPAEGSAAAAGIASQQRQSAQGGQQAVGRLPQAQMEQQLPGMMQVMSLTTAAAPEPAAAAGGRAKTRAARQAAAAAESVDLCSNDDEEEQLPQQQQQQQHSFDAPAVPGGKRTRRDAGESIDEQNLQKKRAWEMVFRHFESDKKSITDLNAMLSNEFERYQDFAHELSIPGAVPDCDRKAVQDMIMQQWDMTQRPAQDLLPYLVSFIRDFADDQQANHDSARKQWEAVLDGKQQHQTGSKKLRNSSAAGGAAKAAAAAAAADSRQRTLKGMAIQIEAPGRDLQPAELQKMQSDLQQRAAEEDAAAAAAAAAAASGGADGDPFDSPQDELNLKMSPAPSDAAVGQADDDVQDLASSDSDVELVEHQEKQQPAPQQQQPPRAPNPWSPGTVAAAAAQNRGAQQPEQPRKQPRRCIQAHAQHRLVKQAVRQVLQGNAAPETLRQIPASAAASGSGSDSGYVTADDGEGRPRKQGPNAAESRTAAGKGTSKQQAPQVVHSPMTVGGFNEELRKLSGPGTQHDQPQIQSTAMPNLGLQIYGSSADHDESAVTDDELHRVPAGEVTSPPQQTKGKPRLRNTPAGQVPGPSVLEAEAAARLQNANQRHNRALAAQAPQQGQGVTSLTTRATRGAAARVNGLGDEQQHTRNRGRGSCGGSVKGPGSSDHVVTIVSD